MSQPNDHEQKFISHLEALVEGRDRGALAALRRGLGKPPGTVHVMDRYVLPFFPEDVRSGQAEPYYLVAALFAFWHQGQEQSQTTKGNFGASLHALVDKEAQQTGSRDEAERRIEKRLIALLNCHRDDLSQHLRQVVSLLKSKEVPVNWAQLLHDIKGWDWESRSVQHGWARSFWARPPVDTSEAVATETI